MPILKYPSPETKPATQSELKGEKLKRGRNYGLGAATVLGKAVFNWRLNPLLRDAGSRFLETLYQLNALQIAF